MSIRRVTGFFFVVLYIRRPLLRPSFKTKLIPSDQFRTYGLFNDNDGTCQNPVHTKVVVVTLVLSNK
jgi:hypothetical protein